MTFASPQIMGIINLTPDSFSGDGQIFSNNTFNQQSFVNKCNSLILQGCKIIDLGAEASGPNSQTVTLEEELRRLKPAITIIKKHNFHKQADFSIDTYKAEVADYCLKNGFKIINDITALRGDRSMAAIIANHQAKVVLMYSKDPSARTTKTAKTYKDIIATIIDFLQQQIGLATTAGIKRENIIIDPGMGAFLSTDPQYSFEVLKRLPELKIFNLPILIGTSRKSFLGGDIADRDIPSLLSDFFAIINGADIIRTHNPIHHNQLIQLTKHLQ